MKKEPLTGASIETGTVIFPDSILDETAKLGKEFAEYYRTHPGPRQWLFQEWMFEKLAGIQAAIRRQGAVGK